MKAKSFKYRLQRGLGNTISEIKNSNDKEKYIDTLKWAVSQNMAYDWQSEGTKALYLYDAICACEEKELFEDLIIKLFLKRNKHELSCQLTEIIELYILDGSKKAKDALEEKFIKLYERIIFVRKDFPYDYCEREQFEQIMFALDEVNGFKAFKKCVFKIGEIILKTSDKDFYYFWEYFIESGEKKYKKGRVERFFLENKNDINILAFKSAKKHREAYKNSPEYKNRVIPKIEVKEVLDGAERFRFGRKPEVNYRFRSLVIQFLKNATLEELKSIAEYAIKEADMGVKAALIGVFGTIRFPMDIQYLIEYARSDNNPLKENAIWALSNFKDKRVHSLALELLEEDIYCLDNLELLKKNFQKSDEELIRKVILNNNNISHELAYLIIEIYQDRHSNSCQDIFLKLYEIGQCSDCRYKILKILSKNKALPYDVLRECLYDSNVDIRRWAHRLDKIRGKY